MGSKVKDMTTEEVKKYLDDHVVETYNLIDVRQDWEYEEFHLPGARLIPLPELPDRMDEININKPTLVYCALGGRSSSAANLMSGQGVKETYNMIGGITAWKNEYAVGPQALGMVYFSGEETPLEILTLAYAMEANLGVFYSEMASSAKSEIAEMFDRLLKFEKGHKAKVFNMARDLDPSLKAQEDLEKRHSVAALEGGMTAAEFIEQNEEYLKTPKGAIEAAMMFEAQALDLYMRYSEKAEKSESMELLYQLAQEEKSHLRLLGKLMVRKIIDEAT
jgi:rhodanese-related sulfurtransferase/rubrerythrin